MRASSRESSWLAALACHNVEPVIEVFTDSLSGLTDASTEIAFREHAVEVGLCGPQPT